MEDLLWILFDSNPGSGSMNFCRQMMVAYGYGNQSSPGESSEGWANFTLRYEREARSLMSTKNKMSADLAETLCEKGNQAEEISSWGDIQEDYRDFAEAYLEYVRERTQLSPDEIRDLASKFERLGYSEYSDDLRASLPTDLSSDIPAITEARDIEAKTKVEQIIQKLLSATGVKQAELKSVFQMHVLDNITLRIALMSNLTDLRPSVKKFTQIISIDENDDAILLESELSFFEFLFALGEGTIELGDQTKGFESYIRGRVTAEFRDLNRFDEAYRTADVDLRDTHWWLPPDTAKYKSAALLELFRMLELPQNTPGYLNIDDLVELRRRIGQDVSSVDARPARPDQIRALLDEFEGDILYQNNPGLDEARSRLSSSN
jgi:hypothetical protein